MLRADVDDLIMDWYSLDSEACEDDCMTLMSPRVVARAAGEEQLVTPHMWCLQPLKVREAESDAATETHSLGCETDAGAPVAEHYAALRKRFGGSRGNALIGELVELANRLGEPTGGRSVLAHEMRGLLDFSRKRNMRVKACAQFNLTEHLRAQRSDTVIRRGLRLLETDSEQCHTRLERARAMRRYIAKRERRRSNAYIRYDVRRRLANNRLRVKGKFLKKAKIDLASAARELQARSINF